uniref:Uncharacterized protein n=1 Tax=Amphora coffeiformis TaxID=265554 RepID=A0A7S3P882_9STRA|mmetsp:Transcript_3944/g.7860  ORF Transcript_3944/g.7860 Transcript_3944/m.7860 type:complete len:241 (+) Transcript_3944:166-888(+)|eukprot:scaffold15108_cov180-Amphora_coffeaeformis.AAC.65
MYRRRSSVAVILLQLGLLLNASALAYSASPMSSAWATYKVALVKRPILTKSLTAAVIASASDALTQRYIEPRLPASADTTPTKKGTTSSSSKGGLATTVPFRHNWWRTCRVFLTGLLYTGPIAHSKFNFQATYVKVSNPLGKLACNTALDMCVFSPPVLAGYFVVMSVLAGQGWDSIQSKLKTKWPKAVRAAWTVWPLANIFNYTLVPLPYRVLYNNMVAFWWTGYLTLVNHQKRQQQKL